MYWNIFLRYCYTFSENKKLRVNNFCCQSTLSQNCYKARTSCIQALRWCGSTDTLLPEAVPGATSVSMEGHVDR